MQSCQGRADPGSATLAEREKRGKSWIAFYSNESLKARLSSKRKTGPGDDGFPPGSSKEMVQMSDGEAPRACCQAPISMLVPSPN